MLQFKFSKFSQEVINLTSRFYFKKSFIVNSNSLSTQNTYDVQFEFVNPRIYCVVWNTNSKWDPDPTTQQTSSEAHSPCGSWGAITI